MWCDLLITNTRRYYYWAKVMCAKKIVNIYIINIIVYMIYRAWNNNMSTMKEVCMGIQIVIKSQ